MSSENTSKHAQWPAMLGSETPEQQVDALRQISGNSEVTGLTLAIVPMAGSRDDDVRMWASEVLESSIKPHAGEVDDLIELMDKNDDGEVCYWAATMLGRLGEASVAAVPTLVSCMNKSMYLPARERAVWALAQVGAQAVDAISALRKVSETSPPRLQRLASEAINRILSDDEAAA